MLSSHLKKTNNTTGAAGEEAAANFLLRKGYEIVARNFKADKCEIDIIAKEKNTLVFVEVKTRSSGKYGNPEEAVTPAKQRNMVRAAEIYVEENGWKNEISFDVISIIPHPEGTFSIHHICDAFSPQGEDF
ncbi:MAG: YraN family protein [Sphingobacteriales bacterium]|nr:MAG: YraN family protein [Sphingobacteriales bacterium]